MPAHHAKRGGTVIQGSFAHGLPNVLHTRLPTMAPATVQAQAPLPFSGQPVQANAAVPPKVIAPPPIRFPGRPVPTAQVKLAPGTPGKASLPFTVPLPKSVVQPKVPALVAVQPKAIQLSGGGQTFQLPPTLNLLSPGGGQRLPEAVQQKMESFFGTSFADVRVHVGPQASSIGALAFTQGANLYFAQGHYNPHTPQGQQMLGHELTHVVQQRAGRVLNPFGSGIAVVQDRNLEAEAERRGRQAAAHHIPILSQTKNTKRTPNGWPTRGRSVQRFIRINEQVFGPTDQENLQHVHPNLTDAVVRTECSDLPGSPRTLAAALEPAHTYVFEPRAYGWACTGVTPSVRQGPQGARGLEVGMVPARVTRPAQGHQDIRITGLLSCVAIIIEGRGAQNMVEEVAALHFVTPQNIEVNGDQRLSQVGRQAIRQLLAQTSNQISTRTALLYTNILENKELAAIAARLVGFELSVYYHIPVTIRYGPSGAVTYRLYANGTGGFL